MFDVIPNSEVMSMLTKQSFRTAYNAWQVSMTGRCETLIAGIHLSGLLTRSFPEILALIN